MKQRREATPKSLLLLQQRQQASAAVPGRGQREWGQQQAR
jgi:hypothetical protein